jgi:hypothetical protein
MNEAEWQSQLLQLAHMLGWEHLHVRKSIGKGRTWTTTTNVVGWPDLLLWSARYPALHIAAELKVGKNKATPGQLAVLSRLSAAGFLTYVWCPDDLDEAKSVLSGRVPMNELERQRLLRLLREVATCPVTLEDEDLDYVEVMVEGSLWLELQDLLKRGTVSPEPDHEENP